MALTNFEKDMAIIQALDDEPNDVGGMTAAELKAKFDEGGLAIKEYINGTLIPNVAKADTTINGHPMGQNVTVTKSDVGLGNVDNTSDQGKPVSAAQQAALDLKADKSNVLEKDTDVYYTPTQDYHPATKQYVDQTLADAVLGQVPDNSIGPEKLTPAFNNFIDQQMPVGGIIMWSGSVSNIPDGWTLCNGQNGTPDLRDRFILGAGAAKQPGDTGGSETATLSTLNLPAHSHSVTGTAASAGDHTHGNTFAIEPVAAHTHEVNAVPSDSSVVYEQGPNYGWRAYGAREGGGDNAEAESAGAHTHTLRGSVSPGGSHSHTVSGTAASAGSGAAFSILPPYYALCFIMKL